MHCTSHHAGTSSFFRLSFFFLLVFALGWPGGGVVAGECLSLAGRWRFRRDEQNAGVVQKWWEADLAAAADGPREVRLPGSTDEAQAGLPNPKKPSLDGLYRPNVYAGAAWYQRDIEVPPAWKEKRVTLFLERVHWVTQVWLDGKTVGSAQDSLVAPHVYELGCGLAPGKHRLTLRVDNTPAINLGPFPSIIYEGTQTNWNGIVGRIELQATDLVAIDDVQVYPDVDRKLAKVQVHIVNATQQPVAGTVIVSANERKNEAKGPQATARFSGGRHLDLTIELPMGDNAKLWDEFSPALYDLNVSLSTDGNNPYHDHRRATFGMRKFAVQATQFAINGRPVFLRGTLECAIFPLTGYPPCDVPAWQRIYKIMKSYGLNFIRFHSWCPPEAAFAAADLEGIMIQAEGPQANIEAGKDPPRDAFTEQELLRMVRTYGNHPSFCMMTLGNEYGGKDELLTHWVDMLIREDPRHVYSSPSSGQPTANRQYTERGAAHVQSPGTESDNRAVVASDFRPMLAHEVGQWVVYPNFDEIKKYTGVLKADNFQLIRNDLQAKGMLDLAPRFFQATGMQAALLYKEEIEQLARTQGHPGFSLLDLHDYPGQGTALIGLLDPFWDSKGFVSPEIHRQYCGPVVPLLLMPKRTYSSDETFEADVAVANFGAENIPGAHPQWTICDRPDHQLASGTLPVRDVPTGTRTSLGTIRTSLGGIAAPCKLTISVGLEDTKVLNSWEIWVYPRTAAVEPPAGVMISKEWDDSTRAALAEGKKVLLMPTTRLGHGLIGAFNPVYWSPVWFPQQKPNTMGILCDPRHPLFAQFPTEFYTNWQWWDLLQGSYTANLDDTPKAYRPIVQVIDNFARNSKLGNVFEARVGKGQLLVCTLNLSGDLSKKPAAQQFLKSLYAYAASDRFQPAAELSVAVLDEILAPPANLLARLGAKVRTDSEERRHGFPAANAIDGDPSSFWHTRWDEKAPPPPHYLVVDMGRPVTFRGVSYLPRQDMVNGRIEQAEIYCSMDGKKWGPPVAKVTWKTNNQRQTAEFAQPVTARYLKLLVPRQKLVSVAELDIIAAGK